MGNQSSRLKFGVIGHQDNWKKIVDFVNNIRITEGNSELSEDKIKDVYDYFPPIKLFDIQINSKLSGFVEGYYIESFLSPDKLGLAHIWNNLKKTKEACEKAAMLGVDVVSLGGFTSIILESGGTTLDSIQGTKFTTGNTLTAALIADSIEKACMKWNLTLEKSSLLVIGSTGDIGSACVKYFSKKVKKLLITARNPALLLLQEEKLKSEDIDCKSTTNVPELLASADLVICVASSVLPENYFDFLQPHAIICDAGYPKNLNSENLTSSQRIYAGGMCLVEGGYCFSPEHFQKNIYEFPLPNISHGCTMESVVLALEEKTLEFSRGRGNIQLENMEYILKAAAKHGIITAPFFNSTGLLN